MINAVKDKIIMEKLMKTKQGGIILPNMENSPQAYGRVISMGPEVKGIQIGDILTYRNVAAKPIYLKRKFYDVMPYDDIYGTIDDAEIISELEEFGSNPTDSDYRAAGTQTEPKPLIKSI